MRALFLSLLTAFFSLCSYAQFQKGFHYIIKKKIPINYIERDTTYQNVKADTTITITSHLIGITATSTLKSTVKGHVTTNEVQTKPVYVCPGVGKLKAGLKQDSSKIIIDFWSIKNSKGCEDETIVNPKKKASLYYFEIIARTYLGDPTYYIKVPYSTWEFGVATIPFKYRFGFNRDTVYVPNDLSLNISAGFFFGRKWGHSNYFIDKEKSGNTAGLELGAFITPMVIPITKDNTFPTLDEKFNKRLEKKPNELGMSLGLGVVFSKNNMNFGLLGGMDLALTGLSKRWYYKNKPWIGFGFGYKLAFFGDK